MNQPPKFALWFFRQYCHPTLAEDIEGDLRELFEERVARLGVRKARWLFVRDVLLLFRPAVVKTVHMAPPINFTAMFTHYFKTGLRNLWKYKSYAALNVFGLAIGIAAAILLLLVVRYERSFDKFHSNYKHIYKIGERNIKESREDAGTLTKTPVVPAMLEDFPEVVNGTRFMDWDIKRLSYEDKIFKCSTIYVDSGFVDLFDFEVLEGDSKATLTTPDHVIVTQSVAQKFFGSTSATGKILEVVDDSLRYVIGAVVADPPKNSSLQFDVLVPWLSAPEWLDLDQGGNWYNTFMNAYVQLAPGADPKALEEKLISFKNKNFTASDRENTEMVLLPLEKLHTKQTNNASVVALLSIIALVTLAIACINFMNLSTAQSLGRVREIGLRKVLGSLRSQLVVQFLTESLLTCFAALFIGIVLVHLALPWFNRYFELSITFDYWQNLRLLALLLGMGIVTGLLAGAYPAVFVSGFRPVHSLKGMWKHSGQNFQKGLIVLQYVCSMLLIAGTVVIWQQIDFMKTQDLHFDKNNVVVMDIGDENFKKQELTGHAFKAIQDRLSNETSVVSAAWTENVPGRYNHNYNSFYAADAPQPSPVSLRQITVGTDYFNTFGIDMIEGRNFSETMASDSVAVVINEAAMKAFGWQDVQDKYLHAGGPDSKDKYKVVGVVQDYHYQTLKEKIQPVIHFYTSKPPGFGSLAVRLQPNRVAEGLQILKKAYATLNPYEPFDYFFMDQEFDKMYKEQERLGTTATLFAFIAIVVASLGLLSLAAFATRRRRKEIGVRKVLGASVSQIVVLLSKNFAWLVLIAFVVACPLIYYAAQQFLQGFAYRIPLHVSVFILAGIAAFTVAIASVCFQSIRAASANPAHSLRDE